MRWSHPTRPGCSCGTGSQTSPIRGAARLVETCSSDPRGISLRPSRLLWLPGMTHSESFPQLITIDFNTAFHGPGCLTLIPDGIQQEPSPLPAFVVLCSSNTVLQVCTSARNGSQLAAWMRFLRLTCCFRPILDLNLCPACGAHESCKGWEKHDGGATSGSLYSSKRTSFVYPATMIA